MKWEGGEEYSSRDTDDEGIYLFDLISINKLFFCCFGNIFLMLVFYDKLKTPQKRMDIPSHMTQKACQYPPTKTITHLERKENTVAMLTMKVRVFVFDSYDVLILLLFR